MLCHLPSHSSLERFWWTCVQQTTIQLSVRLDWRLWCCLEVFEIVWSIPAVLSFQRLSVKLSIIWQWMQCSQNMERKRTQRSTVHLLAVEFATNLLDQMFIWWTQLIQWRFINRQVTSSGTNVTSPTTSHFSISPGLLSLNNRHPESLLLLSLLSLSIVKLSI